MEVSVKALSACGVRPDIAARFAPPLAVACSRFGITSQEQMAGFIAQTLYESVFFTQLEENLSYRVERLMVVWPRRFPTPQSASLYAGHPETLANFVYANRNGNSDAVSGDGWAFRGSGLIQITGRANFAAAAKGTSGDYVNTPELVRTSPNDAALTAAWYWYTNGCNTLMTAAGINAVSKKINGGTNGLDERRHLYERCFASLN
jgi:putative chitinase